MTLVTRNFRLEEFTRSDKARALGIPNVPSGQVLQNIRISSMGAEQIRAIVLRGRALRILSGFRCPEVNLAVGGSSTSAHLTGLAIDVAADGFTAFGLAQAIRDARIAFDQLILETGRGVVHVGFAPEMRGMVLTQSGAAGTPFRQGLVL